MLKMPRRHTGDKKANGIIDRHLNGNILGLVMEDTGTDTLEPIPSGRDYVIGVLKEEYPDRGSLTEADEEDGLLISWQEKLERLEDLHFWEDIYFWDTDYLWLDYFTEDGLAGSAVSDFLGIDNIGDRSRRFDVPPEWMM